MLRQYLRRLVEGTTVSIDRERVGGLCKLMLAGAAYALSGAVTWGATFFLFAFTYQFVREGLDADVFNPDEFGPAYIVASLGFVAGGLRNSVNAANTCAEIAGCEKRGPALIRGMLLPFIASGWAAIVTGSPLPLALGVALEGVLSVYPCVRVRDALRRKAGR